MPTYDYICRACDHAFELFQQMSDPVKRKCPKCGKPKLERLIGTGAGVIFKGGGFYETDYRSDSYRKAAEAEKKSADSASGGGDKSGEKGEKKADAAKAGAEKSGGESSPAKPAGKSDGQAKSSSGAKKKSKRLKS